MATDIISGIYVIRNTISGRVYVGSAVNVIRRWGEHRADLRGGRHHSRYLQNAWKKYGEFAFSFEVIENVPEKSKLIEREQVWIDTHVALYGNSYNISPKAGSNLGVKHSDETRERIRQVRLGKKHTPESKEKNRLAHTGKKMSAEAVEKSRLANLGKKMSPEAIEATRKANIGRKVSEEAKAKMRALRTGVKCAPRSAEWSAKLSSALKGKKKSPEAIAKRTMTRHLSSIKKRAESEAGQGTLRL